jgi:hypothetical protein
MSIPELDPEQRRAALQLAAEARRIRADLKQMLKTGEVTLAEVLDHAGDREALAKMRVSDVLEALPNVGKIRSRRIMERLDIAPTRRLRGLGPRQRQALLDEFDK